MINVTTRGEPSTFIAAAFQAAAMRVAELAMTRFKVLADLGDQEPVLNHLFDSNRDGRISPDEIQAALSMPAKAQAISQWVVKMRSEWDDSEQYWDYLDGVLGHTGSRPNRNWAAEKTRIAALSWWTDVAAKLGLPKGARVWHFHPLGLACNFYTPCDENDLKWLEVPFGGCNDRSDLPGRLPQRNSPLYTNSFCHK